MELSDCYNIVSQSTVAIAVKPPGDQLPKGVPTIIGTGFVVGDGLIVTNNHVVSQTKALLAIPGAVQGKWPIVAVLFFPIPNKGMGQLEMEILGCFVVDTFKAEGYYYGPDKPDLGFLQVNMRGLPVLSICENLERIVPGTQVATAGFPMGTQALRAPGYVHQLTTTLQQGIVSAVLPFPCKTPHALMLNMMSQGGASGSPIFLTDSSDVIGVLYGGLQEVYSAQVQGVKVPYSVPTNFTYCVAGHLLRASIKHIASDHKLEFPEDSPHIDEIREQSQL